MLAPPNVAELNDAIAGLAAGEAEERHAHIMKIKHRFA
jgi:hypothetical protein